ncbi:MAG: AI-2E family transporter [Deltaproteobacteria bacterium]|jgi:predicted PurR-regulated permease PerM|nr:AI-2E family transporter [Deltaproteobacteria bacterium]
MFNISKFAHENRVILIWSAFAGLIYLMRNLFGLVFMTFIMCFLAHTVCRWCTHVTSLPRRLVVFLTYGLFIVGIVCFVLFGFPKILDEAKHFSEQLPKTLYSLNVSLNNTIENYPDLAPALTKVKDALTIDALVNKGFQLVISNISHGWHYVAWFFIAIIFSFLIVLELPELIGKFRSLRFTRLHVIYDETVSSVIQFGKVVGENFRAQIYISLINTSLTILGLTIIGTGSTALLAVIVFSCGLIPVLGVFISSVPIILVSINVGGLSMLWASLSLIVIIHIIEAYVLNPRIVSAVLRINPVITLIILYIAHSLMGMWGMFLGVPISVYIYRQIILQKPEFNPVSEGLPRFDKEERQLLDDEEPLESKSVKAHLSLEKESAEGAKGDELKGDLEKSLDLQATEDAEDKVTSSPEDQSKFWDPATNDFKED